MTPPRHVTAGDDVELPAKTFHVDRAPDGALCNAWAHEEEGEQVPADVVCDADNMPRCIRHWRPVAAVLNARGHSLNYTNAALALWERPGIG